MCSWNLQAGRQLRRSCGQVGRNFSAASALFHLGPSLSSLPLRNVFCSPNHIPCALSTILAQADHSLLEANDRIIHSWFSRSLHCAWDAVSFYMLDEQLNHFIFSSLHRVFLALCCFSKQYITQQSMRFLKYVFILITCLVGVGKHIKFWYLKCCRLCAGMDDLLPLPFSKKPSSDRFFLNWPGFGTMSLEGEEKEYHVTHRIDDWMSSQGIWDIFQVPLRVKHNLKNTVKSLTNVCNWDYIFLILFICK